MAIFTLPKSVQNLLVVGPIYNKFGKLKEVEKLLPEFDWVVFNDGITFNYTNLRGARQHMEMMDELLATGKVIYNVGSIDLTLANKMDILQSDQLWIENWIRTKSNVVVGDFNGSYRVIIVSGGIPSGITKLEQLENNTEVSFVPHPHETYSGGLGYVITNSPLTDLVPRYYRFSVQIGNTPEGRIYGLKVNRNGIYRTILV